MPGAGHAPATVQVMDRQTREGDLYSAGAADAVRCFACGHRCLVKDGLRGICRVRYNREGRLYVPWGYVAALQCDPTEKKPFYHFLPGSRTLTFGMLGCDLHCPFCQNWRISQTIRDPSASFDHQRLKPEDLLDFAVARGAGVVGSSYNEPLITAEWAVDIFRPARQRGLATVFVSNGNATREALEYLRPWVDGFSIDLKAMSQGRYRRLGGVLDRVLETIKMTAEMGFWVEVVTLVVPGFNDSPEELREAARFLASVSPGIPWHVTAFHADYKMTDLPDTPAKTLMRAAEIGREEGLRFVYAGNLPGRVYRHEDTNCPACGRVLVRRRGFSVLYYAVTVRGACPGCDAEVPGVWWGKTGGPPVVRPVRLPARLQ